MPPSDTKTAAPAVPEVTTEKRADGREYRIETTVTGAKLETVISAENRLDVVVGGKA